MIGSTISALVFDLRGQRKERKERKRGEKGGGGGGRAVDETGEEDFLVTNHRP